MTLRISGVLADAIRRAGETAYPAECCGVLGGRVSGLKAVHQIIPVVNRRTDDPRRYLISPDDLLRITLELHDAELEVLGYYHSHPDQPAEPSEFDSEHAWPWYSYVIVRVNEGRSADLTSWVLEEDCAGMRQETLQVSTEV